MTANVPPNLRDELRSLRQRVYELERRRLPVDSIDDFFIVTGRITIVGAAVDTVDVEFDILFPTKPIPVWGMEGSDALSSQATYGIKFTAWTLTDGFYTGGTVAAWKNTSGTATLWWTVMGFI